MRSILLGIVVCSLAACAPSSWGDLAGGTTEDASLAAPRQLSPLTVSAVSTLRPRLKWELAGDATGAIVELSKTRAFDGEIKRYDVAKGRELAVPEDLEAGIWFWRLKGRTEATTGTQTSKVWEVLVRGPGKNGESDTPSGSMLDYDGDGQPDFMIVGDTSDSPSRTSDQLYPLLMFFRGAPGGALTKDENSWVGISAPSDALQAVIVRGGIDLDGDGFGDLIEGVGNPKATDGMPAGGFISFDFGSPAGLDTNRFIDYPTVYSKLPGLHEGADVNGDGYGDVVVGAASSSLLLLGGIKGPAASVTAIDVPSDVILFDDNPRPVIGGFDANGDGLADFVMAPLQAKPGGTTHAHTTGDTGGTDTNGAIGGSAGQVAPMFYTGGCEDLQLAKTQREVKIADKTPANRVGAFTQGDFNGDGLADLASTVDSGNGHQVCIWFGDRVQQLVAGPCVSLAGDMDFGAGLAAADLDASGADVLLIASTAGVRAARLDGGNLTADTVIAAGWGKTLTTIWPGRPGKARWAVIAADGSQVGIFEGSELKSTVSKPNEIVRGFGRAMR